MPFFLPGLIAGAAGMAGSIAGAIESKSAAQRAAEAQTRAAEEGIGEFRTAQQAYGQQASKYRSILQPYMAAGTGALGAQQSLLGLSGPAAAQQQIEAIQQGPVFQAMMQQGEKAILANAAKTGTLRSGTTQGLLGQFRPQLLSQLVQQRFAQLGGLTQLGFGATQAAGQTRLAEGQAGLQTAANVAQLQQQRGAAQAGGILGENQAVLGGIQGALGGFGQILGTQPALQGGLWQQQPVAAQQGGGAGGFNLSSLANLGSGAGGGAPMAQGAGMAPSLSELTGGGAEGMLAGAGLALPF